MNRRYSALALSALAMGAVALTATEASAMLKDPGDRGSEVTTTSTPCNYPNHPVCKVAPAEVVVPPGPSGDNGFEGGQLGALALGGAGVAFGGMWLARRRHLAR
jgi:hypothetical protein